jgi:alpha-galactosidase
MWHPKDSVESAALQLANAIYAVPQVSVKIDKLSEEHKKMLSFYLSFWREHRDVLIDGKILAANPESSYSIVCAERDGSAISTSYTDTLIDCRAYTDIIAVNCSRAKALVIKGAESKSYKVLNCMGETVSEGVIDGYLAEIDVPLSGMIFVK